MIRPAKRYSFPQFLLRYPVFLLAFGPPIFRSNAGIDATKGVLDYWSLVQVGLVSLVALRAIYRLARTSSIIINKQIMSIIKYAFIIGILFLVSTAYSTNRLVSVAYAMLYLFTWISVVDFLVDAYVNPPDWMQCLINLRFIALILFGVVLFTLTFDPTIVVAYLPGVGIRLIGGAVAPVTVICPVVTIVSAYMLLYSFESKVRSMIFIIVGLAGTMITQSRGSEIALFVSLAFLLFTWSKNTPRSAYLFLSALCSSILLISLVIGLFGGGRIWNLFNRGQSIQGIESASGRTQIWSFVIQYCMNHPLGMGYVAGFRTIFRKYYALGLQFDVTHIGSTHNAFIQVLADAGWPALGLYLFMIASIVILAWRLVKRSKMAPRASDYTLIHAIQCAVMLYIFCLVEGMDTSEFSVPLRISFYLQIIIIAIILGASANLIQSSRNIDN